MSRAKAQMKRLLDSDSDGDDASSHDSSSSGGGASDTNSYGSSSGSDAPIPPPKLKNTPVPAPARKRRALVPTTTVPPTTVPPPVPVPPPPPPPVVPLFVPPTTLHMRLQTSAVHHFYTVISTLSPGLLTETHVTFNAEGMYLRALDDSHTIIVDWRVTKDSMEGLYSCNHVFRIKINMEEFVDRIKAGKKFESMELALDSPADGTMPDKLSVLFKSPDRSRKISMLLMQDDDEDALEIPNIQYEHFVTMPSTTFKDTINSIHKTTDHVEFVYNVSTNAQTGAREYEFNISSQTQLSNTTTSFKNVVQFEDAAAPSSSSSSSPSAATALSLKSSFLLARVEKFVRVTNATRFVRIYPAVPQAAGADERAKPMRITYEVTTLGPLAFYIAPVYDDTSQ